MKFNKKKTMKIVGVVGLMALSFVIGVVWSAFHLISQNYRWHRVSAGSTSQIYLRTTAMLREASH